MRQVGHSHARAGTVVRVDLQRSVVEIIVADAIAPKGVVDDVVVAAVEVRSRVEQNELHSLKSAAEAHARTMSLGRYISIVLIASLNVTASVFVLVVFVVVIAVVVAVVVFVIPSERSTLLFVHFRCSVGICSSTVVVARASDVGFERPRYERKAQKRKNRHNGPNWKNAVRVVGVIVIEYSTEFSVIVVMIPFDERVQGMVVI